MTTTPPSKQKSRGFSPETVAAFKALTPEQQKQALLVTAKLLKKRAAAKKG